VPGRRADWRESRPPPGRGRWASDRTRARLSAGTTSNRERVAVHGVHRRRPRRRRSRRPRGANRRGGADGGVVGRSGLRTPRTQLCGGSSPVVATTSRRSRGLSRAKATVSPGVSLPVSLAGGRGSVGGDGGDGAPSTATVETLAAAASTDAAPATFQSGPGSVDHGSTVTAPSAPFAPSAPGPPGLPHQCSVASTAAVSSFATPTRLPTTSFRVAVGVLASGSATEAAGEAASRGNVGRRAPGWTDCVVVPRGGPVPLPTGSGPESGSGSDASGRRGRRPSRRSHYFVASYSESTSGPASARS
jgi:hypothetical protein